jgi:superfamily II RNA helicase
MQFKNLTLDQFQEQAIASVEANNSVIVSAPTGSGKTLIADYIIARDIKEHKRVIYTAPIKALSNQKYKDFVADHGESEIGLITGDTVINPRAAVLIMTTEVYRNMAIVRDPVLNDVGYCIMDEIHFISDEERGYVWEESIIFSPEHIRFLFLSATIPNAQEFAQWVQSIKGHQVDTIRHTIRPVPLEITFYDPGLGITTLSKIRDLAEIPEYGRRKTRQPAPDYRDVVAALRHAHKLPCIYFVFSRAKTQDYALRLKKELLSTEEKATVARIIQERLRGVNRDILMLKSTLALRESLARGVGFHHAGLLPDQKHLVESLFSQGLVKVLFATETFAVGINMPAKTVCFDSLRKYTGTGFRYLNSKEFYQGAGRAGRRGMDKTGLAVAVINRQMADFRRIEEITEEDTMPIISQFRLSYNTVINMVHRHTPAEIDKLLKMNFYSFQRGPTVQQTVKARFAKAVKTLTKMGYIHDGELTEIGLFTTKIFTNELELSQLFMGKFELDEQSTLLVIAALAYEDRREVHFGNRYRSRELAKLTHMIRSHHYLRRAFPLRMLEPLTALTVPILEGKKFVELLKNTDMPEGDLLRFIMQMLDKLEQVDRALNDGEQRNQVRSCKHKVKACLEGMGIV